MTQLPNFKPRNYNDYNYGENSIPSLNVSRYKSDHLDVQNTLPIPEKYQPYRRNDAIDKLSDRIYQNDIPSLYAYRNQGKQPQEQQYQDLRQRPPMVNDPFVQPVSKLPKREPYRPPKKYISPQEPIVEHNVSDIAEKENLSDEHNKILQNFEEKLSQLLENTKDNILSQTTEMESQNENSYKMMKEKHRDLEKVIEST